MAIRKFSPADLLKAATKFEQLVKQAQTYTQTVDPMTKALNQMVVPKATAITDKFFDKNVSTIQLDLNWDGKTVTYEVFAIGPDSDSVKTELPAALVGLTPTITKIMNQYHKEPFINSVKLLGREKPG